MILDSNSNLEIRIEIDNLRINRNPVPIETRADEYLYNLMAS